MLQLAKLTIFSEMPFGPNNLADAANKESKSTRATLGSDDQHSEKSLFGNGPNSVMEFSMSAVSLRTLSTPSVSCPTELKSMDAQTQKSKLLSKC